MSSPAPGTTMLHLSAEFPPTPTDAWDAAIAKDLKGADFDARLLWRPEEGLTIRPYYRREDLAAVGPHVTTAPGEFPFVRGGRAGWEILEHWRPTAETVRADLWHDAGATVVQEIGFAIAAGVDRIAALGGEGVSAEAAAGRLSFAFAIGSTFFLEIAKLRAARLLWAQACSGFGVRGDGAMMRIDARTARANKTLYDPYTNLLRVTTEALSAVLGGCQRLLVEPFGFDRHLATNVHHILREEAHLAAVADAGGGAYYLEALTDAAAREGWSLFQRLEQEGGFAAATAAGTIDHLIAEARATKTRAVSSRRRTLLGVNNYPNLVDREPAALPPALAGTDPSWRMAEPFEAIRRRTEEYVARTGRRPVVTLLRRGDPKIAGARANFSLNFFGCAGFDIVDALEVEGGGADLIVLCSADAEYPAIAREIVPKATAPVVVAGNPAAYADELRTIGVQGFVHLRSDAVETLTEWQSRLHIE